MAMSRTCCEKDELRQFEVDVSVTQAMQYREAGKPFQKEVLPNLNESTRNQLFQLEWYRTLLIEVVRNIPVDMQHHRDINYGSD